MIWSSLITVIFIWMLIFCLALSFFSLFLPALFKEDLECFYLVTSSCSITLTLSCVSYLRAVWTSPGYPQENLVKVYKSQVEDLKRRAEQQKQFKKLRKQKKLTGQISQRQIQNLIENSWCQKCNNAKLSRVHHCRQCRRCIERMDHHCPWVGNCIGKQNHKYFFLFLFYITIALLIVSLAILADYISGQAVISHIAQMDEIYYYIILMTGGMCTLLLFAVSFLLVTQIMMICTNITTLQSFYDGIHLFNPFQTGSITSNIKQIAGDSLWFLPTKPFPEQKDEVNVSFQS